jgi:hypothetical protein
LEQLFDLFEQLFYLFLQLFYFFWVFEILGEHKTIMMPTNRFSHQGGLFGISADQAKKFGTLLAERAPKGENIQEKTMIALAFLTTGKWGCARDVAELLGFKRDNRTIERWFAEIAKICAGVPDPKLRYHHSIKIRNVYHCHGNSDLFSRADLWKRP